MSRITIKQVEQQLETFKQLAADRGLKYCDYNNNYLIANMRISSTYGLIARGEHATSQHQLHPYTSTRELYARVSGMIAALEMFRLNEVR